MNRRDDASSDAGGHRLLDRRHQDRIAHPAGDAERDGEVVGTDQGGVDAGHRHDLLDPLDRLPSLDLDDHEGLPVGVGHHLGDVAGLEFGVTSA